MKKCLSLLTALLCAAAMLLTACGKEPSPGSSVVSDGSEASVPNSDPSAPNSDPSSGVSDASTTSGGASATGTKAASATSRTGGSTTPSSSFSLNDRANKTGGTVKNNCHTVGYPIADKKVTLSVMIKDYTGLSNYSAMKINEFLKEKMNIQIEWIVVSAEQVGKRMNLAYTSGDLPDMFMGMAPATYETHWKYIKQGLVVQLDDLLKTYAPNITAMFAESKLAKYYATAEDGHIYMLPMINEEEHPRIYESLFINNVWLKNLGLSVPKTTDQLKSVLQAFRDNDPNGNGKKDEIPLLLKATSMAGSLPGCLYGPFGLSVYGGNVGTQIDDNGKVQLNYISDGYKRALIYYRDLYQAGMINSDWTTCSEESYRNRLRAQTPVVGAFVADNATELLGAARIKDHTFVPALSNGKDKTTWAVANTEYIWSSWFLITKACKYPEIAVRFADYFYSNEGSMTALYGPQGYNWDVDKSGKITMTDAYYSEKYKSSDLTPGYPLPAWRSAALSTATEIPAAKMKNDDQRASAQEKKVKRSTYGKVAPKYPQINYYIWDQDKKNYTEVEDYLNTYVQELNTQFLKNECNIETFWDNYVSVCKTLGCETQRALLQKSADRYFAAMGK